MPVGYRSNMSSSSIPHKSQQSYGKLPMGRSSSTEDQTFTRDGENATSPAKTPIEFPQYLLDHVFVHLELPDLYRCQRVCRSWRSAILYYPSLKPTLFRSAPGKQSIPSSLPLSSNLQDGTCNVHPVFSAVEQDWSIVLQEPVFSQSKSRNPMVLTDYPVKDDLATYPAMAEMDICADFEGLGIAENTEGAPRARRNANNIHGRMTFNLKLFRQGGVTVGDVWEGLIRL